MYVGINIQNSIDGSKAFGAGIFSFRSACKNMALVAAATQSGWKLHIAKQQTIETISKRHTKGIDPQTFKLKLVISQIMSKATGLIDAYERMATQKATEELLLSLGNSRLSSWTPMHQDFSISSHVACFPTVGDNFALFTHSTNCLLG